MNQIIFTQTFSGDRTNICSSFELWSKETFLKNLSEGKDYGRYRYGYVDSGYVKLTKDMLLDEFESVFTPEEIKAMTPEVITDHFRKDISEKYGKHAEWKQVRNLTAKELIPGGIYSDIQDYSYLYLGKGRRIVEQVEGYNNSKRKVIEDKEGHCFIYWGLSDKKRGTFESDSIANMDVLKGIKKLTKCISVGVKFDTDISYVRPKSYYFSEKHYTLKLKNETPAKN